jgi:predicted metal-dependent HD superfamily phosphohydrolase
MMSSELISSNRDREILAAAETYVTQYITEHVNPVFEYHQLNHTVHVVDKVRLIGTEEKIPEEQFFLTMLAAWFHDAGYDRGPDNHEQRSIEQFRNFALRHALPDIEIGQVEAMIMSTRMPQAPESQGAKILCDADLFNLSSDQFLEFNQQLFNEYRHTQDESITEQEWLKRTVELIKTHSYFTNYGQTVLESRKAENLQKLEERIAQQKKQQKKAEKLEKNIKDLNQKISSLGEFMPDRGIETMFRLTSKNHLELSAMADNKANIMISINSIVLSVVVSVLIRKIEESPFLMYPTIILTTVCLATIVFAILSLIPNISRGRFERKDIIERNINLLFFGNFHQMPLADYEWGVKEMMKDSDYLYGSLIRDIYYLGRVLSKKYKLLRTCYTIFMFGFVIAILSFILAYSVF